jgi:3-hydroxyisobutyrate dehydrogenase-like beta-hydroxyacid dehydrogenase
MTGSVDQLSTNARPADVAVLGCGNMGAAFARTLLASGRRVAVWNRTAARAEALAQDGALVQAAAHEALAAAPLVVVCVGSTDDAREVLESIGPERLLDRTVLNVTSGTPDDGRDLGAWAHEHGVRYLDAAILAYPEQIGSEPARILVAGDEELWKAHEDVVRALAGSSMYVGADHGAANVIDAGFVGAFYISSLTAFIEAARFMSRFGVALDVLDDLVSHGMATLEGELHTILSRISKDDFTTDQATLDVYADASAAFAAAMGTAADAPVIHTTANVLRRAVEAGLGDQDIAAVFSLQA